MNQTNKHVKTVYIHLSFKNKQYNSDLPYKNVFPAEARQTMHTINKVINWLDLIGEQRVYSSLGHPVV